MKRQFNKEHALTFILGIVFLFIGIPLTLSIIIYLPWSIGMFWEKTFNFDINYFWQWGMGVVNLFLIYGVFRFGFILVVLTRDLYNYIFPEIKTK